MRFLGWLSILLFSFSTFANENDIFSYDLAELAQIEVKVATKSEVSLRYVPAMVSVFTQAQLTQQGIEQLADLAEITPGFSSYSIFGEKVFVTRGQKAGSFENNKHLVLLDGIALNHARSNKAPIEYELPLYVMGQVEMLTGPASSLYGVGAFFGITNLTSDLKNNANLEAKLNYSPGDQASQFAIKSNVHSEFGHSFLAFSDYSKQATEQEVGPDFSPLQKYYDDQEASFVYIRHAIFDGPSLGYIRLERDSGLGEHWNGDYSTARNNINWLTEISFVQWPLRLSQQLNLELQWVNNDSVERGLATTFAREAIIGNAEVFIEYNQYQVNVESDQGQIELHWTPNDEQQFLFGLSHTEKQDVGGFFISGKVFAESREPQGSYQRRASSSLIKFDGVYGQYLASFPQWWNIQLTAGLRYDSGEYQENKFSHTSPRVALVKEIDQNLLLRVSYRSALRSPDLKEYALNEESKDQIELHAVNPIETLNQLGGNLEAEIFDSLEIAAMFDYNEFSGQLTVFRNQSEYTLIAQPIIFVNIDGNKQLINSFENSSSNINLWAMSFQENGLFLNGVFYKGILAKHSM